MGPMERREDGTAWASPAAEHDVDQRLPVYGEGDGAPYAGVIHRRHLGAEDEQRLCRARRLCDERVRQPLEHAHLPEGWVQQEVDLSGLEGRELGGRLRYDAELDAIEVRQALLPVVVVAHDLHMAVTHPLDDAEGSGPVPGAHTVAVPGFLDEALVHDLRVVAGDERERDRPGRMEGELDPAIVQRLHAGEVLLPHGPERSHRILAVEPLEGVDDIFYGQRISGMERDSFSQREDERERVRLLGEVLGENWRNLPLGVDPEEPLVHVVEDRDPWQSRVDDVVQR